MHDIDITTSTGLKATLATIQAQGRGGISQVK